ncbi:MAG: DUF4102 domain-containing protein [Gammaproteobacteria bacterium]|jgi:hypothetical protein|nr:DUF4102 domain-containing protein [Gammaproteobacteria bacterium]
MYGSSITFTESYIKGLPIPVSGDDSYSDRGLRLRVYPSGSKKWSYWKHAPNGVRKSVAIGEYPSVSLKQAREVADKFLGDMLESEIFSGDRLIAKASGSFAVSEYR